MANASDMYFVSNLTTEHGVMGVNYIGANPWKTWISSQSNLIGWKTRIFSNLKTMQFDLQKLKLHPWRVKVGQWEGQLLLHDKNKILG